MRDSFNSRRLAPYITKYISADRSKVMKVPQPMTITQKETKMARKFAINILTQDTFLNRFRTLSLTNIICRVRTAISATKVPTAAPAAP